MSYTLTRISIRPDTSVPFWEFNDEDNAHFQTEYLDKGRSLSRTITVSEDGLTQYRVNEWDALDSWAAYSNDPRMIPRYAERDAYNAKNHIYSYLADSTPK